MKGSKFVFDSVDLFHYKCHKISLNRGESYIDSPKWLKNKKATRNLKNKDEKCFQFAITAALNHENIVKSPQRMSKNKYFINQYDCKETSFPLDEKDWKNFESTNKVIALNVLSVPHNSKEIRHACVSKHNATRENQVILLMITDVEKWHYLAVKNLPALLREKTRKYDGDYCLNFLHSFRTKNELKKHEDVCKNYDYCYVEMPEKDKDILKYNHRKKSMNVPFIIYAGTESSLEKVDTCHSGYEK